ncbi:LacI family DNA-binding transcriptional regulator [Sphingosinicella terrae]|uniref:LacI family DNA-binding transcriptional regulator n=1 Tax=Sphingosinicella terrae TaxID=2172047 RepID=UPI00254978D9|nr:LacI family DNA-binding transcriptional regulator [Sphingosinicella terrae]
MIPGGSAPRIHDVAARAGVSAATVSRFFNMPGLLAEETAERIRRAVEEIGYVPNLNAGGLASRRSGLVAVFVPVISNSIFNPTIEAMVDALSAEGMSTMLAMTGPRFEVAPRLIDAALGRQADAIVLTGGAHGESVRRRLREHPTLVVETWGLPEDPINYAVGFSHRAVGEAVAQFLGERGYRRPLLVVAEGSRAQSRRDGFVERWTTDGGSPPVEMKVSIPSRFGHGRAAFRRVGELDPRPDVVVCGSDSLAQGVIVEALHAGIRIPDDLAIFGFGNLAVAGEMRPTISTVDIDGGRIGRETVRLLKQRGEGRLPDERKIDVGFRIIARESA